METGYAVATNGKIDVRTVSPTERAAQVNWLVVECGFAVLASASDENIAAAFAEHALGHGVDVVRVTIAIARDEQFGG